MNIDDKLNMIVDFMGDIKGEIKLIKEQMATKEELKQLESRMVTKDDIKDMVVKDDIKDMVVKDDVKDMATKNDIKSIQRDIRKIKTSIQTIIEDIKMLDDRTRPIIRIK